jgi:hypothetical protein
MLEEMRQKLEEDKKKWKKFSVRKPFRRLWFIKKARAQMPRPSYKYMYHLLMCNVYTF